MEASKPLEDLREDQAPEENGCKGKGKTNAGDDGFERILIESGLAQVGLLKEFREVRND